MTPASGRDCAALRRCCANPLIRGALFATLVSVVGCQAPPPAPISIAVNPWPGYEYLFLAEAQGYFEQEGLSVKLVEYASLSDSRRAFERGRVDGFTGTLVEVLIARHNADREPQVVLIMDYSDGADRIMATEEIHTVADLKHKKVGVETASLNLFMLARALEQAGLSINDVDIRPMNQTSMERAVVSGAVDAVVTYPPVSLNLDMHMNMQTIFSSADIPGEVIDVVALDSTLVRARPEAVRGLTRAWDRALQYAAQHPAEAHEFVAQRERISREDVARTLSGIHLVPVADQPAFFGSGGRLLNALRLIEQTLRASGAVGGDNHSNCCVSALPTLATAGSDT